MVWKIHFRLEFAFPESILIRRWGKWDTSSMELLRIGHCSSAFLSFSQINFTRICSLASSVEPSSNFLKTKQMHLKNEKVSGVGREEKKSRRRQKSNPLWYFYSVFNDIMVSY